MKNDTWEKLNISIPSKFSENQGYCAFPMHLFSDLDDINNKEGDVIIFSSLDEGIAMNFVNFEESN